MSVRAAVQPVLSECTAVCASRNSLKWAWLAGSGTHLGRECESTDCCHASSQIVPRSSVLSQLCNIILPLSGLPWWVSPTVEMRFLSSMLVHVAVRLSWDRAIPVSVCLCETTIWMQCIKIQIVNTEKTPLLSTWRYRPLLAWTAFISGHHPGTQTQVLS